MSIPPNNPGCDAPRDMVQARSFAFSIPVMCWILAASTWSAKGVEAPPAALYNNDGLGGGIKQQRYWGAALGPGAGIDDCLRAAVDETVDLGAHLFAPGDGWVVWWQSEEYPMQEHALWLAEQGLPGEEPYVPGEQPTYVLNGGDLVQVFIDRCRKKGVPAYLTFRMNDYHWNEYLWLPEQARQSELFVHDHWPLARVSRFLVEHWEHVIGPASAEFLAASGNQEEQVAIVLDPQRRWPLRDRGVLDWARPEVRAHKLAFLSELATYDIDGIELDFMRHSRFFKDEFPFNERIAIMAGFIGDVRRALDEAAPEGRRRRLAARVPLRLSQMPQLGIDLEAFVEAGLDYVNLSQHFYTTQDSDLAAVVQLLPGTPVYLEMTQASMSWDGIWRAVTPEQLATAAHVTHARGGAGLSYFNIQYYRDARAGGQATDIPFDLMRRIRDPRQAARMPQHYFVGRGNNTPPAAGARQMPRTLQIGSPASLFVDCAPPAGGWMLNGKLRMEASAEWNSRTLRLRLNGVELEPLADVGEPYPDPAYNPETLASPGFLRAWKVPPHVLVDGANEVRLELLSGASIGLVFMDLAMGYTLAERLFDQLEAGCLTGQGEWLAVGERAGPLAKADGGAWDGIAAAADPHTAHPYTHAMREIPGLSLTAESSLEWVFEVMRDGAGPATAAVTLGTPASLDAASPLPVAGLVDNRWRIGDVPAVDREGNEMVPAAGTRYRVRSTWDLAADDGRGLGSLEIMNLDEGETGYTRLYFNAGQTVSTAGLRLDEAPTPPSWSHLGLLMGGGGNEAYPGTGLLAALQLQPSPESFLFRHDFIRRQAAHESLLHHWPFEGGSDETRRRDRRGGLDMGVYNRNWTLDPDQGSPGATDDPEQTFVPGLDAFTTASRSFSDGSFNASAGSALRAHASIIMPRRGTVELLVYHRALNMGIAFGGMPGGDNRWYFGQGYRVMIGPNMTTGTLFPDMQAERWYYAAVTWERSDEPYAAGHPDEGKYPVTVNGWYADLGTGGPYSLVQSISDAETWVADPAAPVRFGIGAVGGASSYLDGMTDAVALYDDILPPATLVEHVAALSGYSYNLTYRAGPGGRIPENAFQRIHHGGSAAEVPAVADEGAVFDRWSNGVTDNPRTDTSIGDDVDVTARFRSAGGVPIDWFVEKEITPAEGQNWSDLDAVDLLGKGMTLREDYYALTNPHDPASLFRVVQMAPGIPGQLRCAPFSSNRVYQLYYSEDLLSGVWTNLPGQEPVPGGNNVWLTDTNAISHRRYYRIKVFPP